MRFTATHLKPRIGALVETDLETMLSGTIAADIRALLEDRGVMVIRGIQLDDAQQLAFTKTLGQMGEGGAIYKVTFDLKENPTHADYNYGNFSWHIDRTDLDIPPLGTILSPRRLTPVGGQTQFANTYASYADLPEARKKQLEGLRVVHRVASSFRETVPNPTEEQIARWATHPDKIQPLVWTHRSGRKSLAISTSACEVVGMPRAEGEALLREVMEWATQPDYVYEHPWQMGDVVMWDNTGTMHKVLPYDLTYGRLLHRTTLQGEEPLALEAA